MLGASVACLAQRRTGADLLLVQPELRPGAYFRGLAKTTEPLAPGPSPRQMMEASVAPGMAYGYPVPRRIVERAEEADSAVGSALAAYSGNGAIIRHERPELVEPASERFEQVEVPGAWRFGTQNHPALAAACAEWLDRSTGCRPAMSRASSSEGAS
jgi:hypothetical protein